MICIELSFTDDPARLAARPAHRDRLADLHARGLLLAAGPWSDDSGALIVLRTDDAGAREVVDSDPYFTTPGVQVISVRQWQPIIAPRYPTPATRKGESADQSRTPQHVTMLPQGAVRPDADESCSPRRSER